MKNYKNLVPIGLVVFMGVGIYSVFANAATETSDSEETTTREPMKAGK